MSSSWWVDQFHTASVDPGGRSRHFEWPESALRRHPTVVDDDRFSTHGAHRMSAAARQRLDEADA
jgi:hypothetical protein